MEYASHCTNDSGLDACWSVMPVRLSRVETILHVMGLSQGIPINMLIGVVIARQRRLHNPRNAFWLGIIVLNLLTMFMAVLKLVVVHVAQPGDLICLCFSGMTGKPYTVLLFVMLSATLDRYVAISNPLYHRQHVTVRLVIIVQLGISAVIFFLLSMPFIFNWIPLRCGFNLTLGKWTMLLRSVLVTLCIAAQVKVYLLTRKYLRQAEVQPLATTMRPLAIVSDHRHPPSGAAAAGSARSLSTANSTKNAKFFVHRRDKTVSKLELEASLTLVFGVLSLCIITAPMFVVYFSLSVCQQVGGDCSGLTSMVVYVRQAALVHAVYGPLVYIIRSREFASAFRKWLRSSSVRLDDNYF